MEKDLRKARFIVKVRIFVQGILNYFGFFILISSSESLAKSFGYNNWVSIITM